MLKRLAGCMILSAVLASPASAQGFGLRAGLTFADITDVDDLDSRTGFAVGVNVRLPIASTFVTTEALYVQKGAEDFEADFLEGSALLKLGIPLPGISLYGLGGPFAAYRVACDVPVGECNDEKWDYGLALGAGIRFGALKGITAEARYEWGFKNLAEDGAGVEPKSKTWLLLAGFDF